MLRCPAAIGLVRALLPALLALLSTPSLVFAQPAGPAAVAQERAALACIASRYTGSPLSLVWVEPEGRHERLERGVYSVRWLTPAGSVLAVRVSDSRCRLLLIEGVGQVEARILP